VSDERWQPDRDRFRRWLREDVTRRANGQPVALAVEGCTGWRYVVDEIVSAGFEAHLAEPADTQAAAKNSSHHRSPDHQYYAAVKERHDGKIAAISVARQFARRCYHVLRNLDPDIVYAMPN
jgi:hypothetical protein